MRALWVSGAVLVLAGCEQGRRVRDELPGVGLVDAGVSAPDAGEPSLPAPNVCSGDGWCWDGFGLQNNALYAVAGDPASELWAVGEVGMVLRFDGQRWSAPWAPTRELLRSVWAGSGEVWAVGEHGTVVHHTPDGWAAETVPGIPWDSSLRGVWAAGDGVWVAGGGGVLLERRAGVWSSVEAAAGSSWNAVWASADEVWAVGDAGAVLHRGSEGWVRVDAGVAQDLLAVRGRPGEVWIAGNAGVLRRYRAEDDTWQAPPGEGPAPQGRLSALHLGAEPGTGPALVANELGQLFTWDGATTCPVPGDAGAPEQPCPEWRGVRSVGSELPIFGLIASGDSALAVGALGSITRWDGDARTPISEGAADSYLDIAGSAAGEPWIAGDRLLARSGDRWREVGMDSPRAAYAVQPLADGRTLIAGTAGLARGYADDVWHDMDVRADAWLHALFSDGQSGWLVGSRGGSWGLLNGRTWVPLATPTERDLLAVFGLPSGNVWAVGAAGVTLRHDGSAWVEIPSGPSGGVAAELRAVWGSADDDVWAVGTGGTTLHWDGVVWSSVGEDAAFSLNALWGRARDDVWAAGSGGTLLHYDGSSWQPQFSGTTQALHGLWGTASRLWAVGEHGTLLVKNLD
jgi:hypothetical protein